ncbi:MAG: CoA ester lyase [Caldilineaceae bacterium]|nr:CoA ester lyase [Caldilineaceae bacterium]
MTPPLRSLLFMPADSPRKIAKGAELPADAIIADLEDAVAPSRKQKARSLLVESFRALPPDGPLRSIRINPVHSPFWPDDLLQTFAAAPQLYVIPKVESAADLQRVDERLTPLESNADLPVGSVRLLPIVESAAGVVNLPEIARADPRIVALAFGAEDFAGDIGAQRTREGWEVFYARSAVVTVAAAFGLQAIDTVYTDLAGDSGLSQECETVQKMGFRGKLAIHPRQVEIINRAFTPDLAEVAAARRLIAVFEAHRRAGRGVCVLDGKMVDMPMYRAAQDLLARAGNGT